MKLHIKLFYIVPAALMIVLIALMWLFMVFDPPLPVQKKSAETLSEEFFADGNEPEKVILERFTSDIAPENSGANDLVAMLQDSAAKVVLSLLGKNSRIIRFEEIEFSGERTARLRGTAVIPGDSENSEQYLNFSVQVNFIAGIGCEAMFPEFDAAVK